MKKLTIAFTGILLFVAIVAMKPKTINIPPDHDTLGELNPPIALDPDVELDVWKIINESGCDLDINVFFTIDDPDNTQAKFIPISSNSNSTSIITSTNVLDLFGLNSNTNILNSSIEIKNSNGYVVGYGYPGQTTVISNGQEGPCNCLVLIWDINSRTIKITSC